MGRWEAVVIGSPGVRRVLFRRLPGLCGVLVDDGGDPDIVPEINIFQVLLAHVAASDHDNFILHLR